MGTNAVMDANQAENPTLTAKAIMDANEAASFVAYKASEVIAIYPITPSSPMGEFADQWAAEKKVNLWGAIPMVQEMQSEGGAAGTVHGSLQTGALTTTFTASQGLLLMIPNMYKIAGELTSTVFHIAARSLAVNGLSIFGDHSDVMACRATGFAMLFSNSVQEAMDMAAVAHAATLASRVPFLHAFDGFRTSHEVNTIERLADEVLREMLDAEAIRAHRARGLNPDHPVLRGTAQNPDVYFQGREASNPYYAATPALVQRCMDRFGELTGRHYSLFEYHGHPQAEQVTVLMGSGVSTVRATVDKLVAEGRKVGVLTVRLYRPFDTTAFLAGDGPHPGRSGPHQGARFGGRAAPAGRPDRGHAGHGGRDRPVRQGPAHRGWSLWPLLQGVHPHHGPRHLRRVDQGEASSRLHRRHPG
jgi:pyruvate-ferredoxin/flavodoxin oxidoreductase